MSYISRIAGRLVRWASPQQLYAAAVGNRFPREKMQTPDRLGRYSYSDGPMYFLGQQIVKLMEDAGYPAKIHCCYRSPDDQLAAFNRGASKAGPWQSPHQLCEAVDIIHISKGWSVTDDFWDTLHACAEIIEEKYGVTFEHGYDWGWDKAHIELKDWRVFAAMHREQYRMELKRFNLGGRVGLSPERVKPDEAQLWRRFCEVLPGVSSQYMARRRKSGKRVPGSSF